jgi:hypothetical protein
MLEIAESITEDTITHWLKAVLHPGHASAVLVLAVALVPVVVWTRTGSVGRLSAAWRAVVAAAAGPGAYLLPGVCQRKPDLGGQRCVVAAEVGEEDVPA